MTNLVLLQCDPSRPHISASRIAREMQSRAWVQLQTIGDFMVPPPVSILPPGPGVILPTGGSSGGRGLCFQPRCHLDRSAAATAAWLRTIDLAPANCLILNPLPLHHISGLMSWWRSHRWGASHHWLSASLLKQPLELERSCELIPNWEVDPVLLSLVPTQLGRLLEDPVGLRWLQHCAVIWVGGAILPRWMVQRAREARLRLAPCYGATETTAMATAQTPQAFLAGEGGCGYPLEDVELKLAANGALQIRCNRLGVGLWRNGQLETVQDPNGWWHSSDAAQLTVVNGCYQLLVEGRIDGALLSGGETVFPEQLERRLLDQAKAASLPLAAVLVLAIPEREWGERPVALVRWHDSIDIDKHQSEHLESLQLMVRSWPPAERPLYWYHCSELRPGPAGKWQREFWRRWLRHRILVKG